MESPLPKTGPGEPENPVYLPTYDGCYVCGQNHPRGLRIRFFADDARRVYARFRPDQTQTGYDDIVHGGVVSTLLDELIGWPVSLHHGLMAFTAELTVRFARPLRAGRSYLAYSAIGSGRGRLWEAEGGIRDADGTVYAKGHGKYFLLTSAETTAMAAKMNYQAGDLTAFRHQQL